MTFLRSGILIALLGAIACGGGETATAPDPAPAPAPALEEPPPFEPSDAENIALVPSPVETQRALSAAGIEATLGELIPDRTLDMQNAGVDQAAVRSGVVLADMLLTVKTAEKDQLIANINAVRTGMQQLNGGKDIDNTLRDMAERVKADAVTRDELLKEFDELSGAVIPELEFNGQDRVVPLIEAGSWLEGANLVAKAVKAAGKASAADNLLKQPAVVDYFIKYIKTEGAEHAPETVTAKLEASLISLKGLAEKTEPLSDADIDKVIEVTDNVLALL